MENIKELQEKLLVFILGMSLAFVGLLASAGPALAQGRPLNYSLQTLDGRTLSSGSLQGKVVVLALGGRNNPLDRALLPQLQRLSDRYQGKNVAVVWVSTDSPRGGSRNFATDEDIRSFVSRAGFSGIVARDPEGALLRSVGANQLPTIVIIDRRGVISSPLLSGFDPDSQDALVELSVRVDKLLP